jgi:hypothetical protein
MRDRLWSLWGCVSHRVSEVVSHLQLLLVRVGELDATTKR